MARICRMDRMRKRSRGPVPRKAPRQPLHIKVLLDLFSACLLMSIDIQVLADLDPILQILCILAILLQTKKARREKTTPRAQSIQARFQTAPTASRGTSPRATVISPASLHRTSSTNDSQQKQDREADASLMSHAYHQTQLPQSDSSIQHPASQTHP